MTLFDVSSSRITWDRRYHHPIGRDDTEYSPLQIPSIDHPPIRFARCTVIPRHCSRYHHTRKSGHPPYYSGFASISEPAIIDRSNSRDMRSTYFVVRPNQPNQWRQELESSLSSMLLDPFASHVIRALFILLDPHLSEFAKPQAVRSKRSAGFKARQGAMLSVFDNEAGKTRHRKAPEAFLSIAERMLSNIRQSLSPTEIRALAAHKVAAPTLKVHTRIISLLIHTDLSVQILLELEANFKQTDVPGSFADSILMGVVTGHREDSIVLRCVSGSR